MLPLVSTLMALASQVDTRENALGWTGLYDGVWGALARDWSETLDGLADGVLINRADGACRRRHVGFRERIKEVDGGDPTKVIRVEQEAVRTEVASPDMLDDEQHRARLYVVRGLVRSTRIVWGTGIPSTMAAVPLALERIRELEVREVTVDVSGMNHSSVCAAWIEGLQELDSVDTVYIEPLHHPAVFTEPEHARGLPTASLPARFLLDGHDQSRFRGSIAVHNTNHPLTPEWAERWEAWGVTPSVARADAIRQAEQDREAEEAMDEALGVLGGLDDNAMDLTGDRLG